MRTNLQVLQDNLHLLNLFSEGLSLINILTIKFENFELFAWTGPWAYTQLIIFITLHNYL